MVLIDYAEGLYPCEIRFNKPVLIPNLGAIRSLYLSHERLDEYTIDALLAGKSVEDYLIEYIKTYGTEPVKMIRNNEGMEERL